MKRKEEEENSFNWHFVYVVLGKFPLAMIFLGTLMGNTPIAIAGVIITVFYIAFGCMIGMKDFFVAPIVLLRDRSRLKGQDLSNAIIISIIYLSIFGLLLWHFVIRPILIKELS